MTPGLIRLGQTLLLTSLSSLAIAPSLQAQTSAPETECHTAALTFGASERDRDRAQYLCDGALSRAPAECYWQALSLGASVKAQDRAARLCRGAGTVSSALSASRSVGSSSNPAQCYWNSLSFGASRRSQYRALQDCSAQPGLDIPLVLKDCAVATQRQLRVSRSSALLACFNAVELR